MVMGILLFRFCLDLRTFCSYHIGDSFAVTQKTAGEPILLHHSLLTWIGSTPPPENYDSVYYYAVVEKDGMELNYTYYKRLIGKTKFKWLFVDLRWFFGS